MGLPADQVDQFLHELGEAVMVMRADHAMAHAQADQLDQELEACFGESGTRIDRILAVDRSLLCLRSSLATDSARGLHSGLQDLIAWWAFASVVALAAAASRREPDAVMLAAGNPTQLLEADELQQLPTIDEHDRSLAELTLSLTGRMPTPESPDTADFDAQAIDYFERVGLRVRTSPTGERALVEDGSPQPRRCRLWGDVWKRHRTPALLSADQLARGLERTQASAETAEAIRAVANKTDALQAAWVRFDELEARFRDEPDMTAETEEAINVEIDTLWDETLSKADDTLIEFAQTLTGHLPAIRT